MLISLSRLAMQTCTSCAHPSTRLRRDSSQACGVRPRTALSTPTRAVVVPQIVLRRCGTIALRRCGTSAIDGTSVIDMGALTADGVAVGAPLEQEHAHGHVPPVGGGVQRREACPVSAAHRGCGPTMARRPPVARRYHLAALID